MLRLLLTGGGTAGHVTPQLALIEYLQKVNCKVVLSYVGSKKGIERRLICECNVPYYAITTGKWHRYWSWKNLFSPFQVIIGLLQAICICYSFKPTLLFSKGGFVALPVVMAAWLCRIPIVVHESDVIPGLANRLSFPVAKLICCSFPTRLARYQSKCILTGLPTRESLQAGSTSKGIKLLRFDHKKPILLVWGGSLGATVINESVCRLLPKLLKQFQVVHLCGPHKASCVANVKSGYRVFEYLDTVPLSHVLACTDMVVSRAGATAIYELLVLGKPNVLCPLSTQVSRGEQIKNAQYCEDLGVSKVIYPSFFNDATLLNAVQMLHADLASWQSKLQKLNLSSGTAKVYAALLKGVKN